MSDLQCPAWFHVVRAGTPGSDPRALVPAEHRDAVVHVAEPGQPVDLMELSDLYRGETVVVLVDLPPRQLPTLAPGEQRFVEVDSLGVRAATHR